MRQTWVSVIKRVWICLVVLRRLLLHQLTDSEEKHEKSSRVLKKKKKKKKTRRSSHLVMTSTSLSVTPLARASSHWLRRAVRLSLAAAA